MSRSVCPVVSVSFEPHCGRNKPSIIGLSRKSAGVRERGEWGGGGGECGGEQTVAFIIIPVPREGSCTRAVSVQIIYTENSYGTLLKGLCSCFESRLARQNTPPPLPVVCLVILQVKVLLLSEYARSVVLSLVIIDSNLARLVWLPSDQWHRRYTIHKHLIQF